jgi:hypothetical protein
MDFVTPFIKPGIDLVKSGLKAARKRLGKKRYDQLVSSVITELLKEHPDLTSAEAQLAAIRATGATPDMHFLRAESMLGSVRRHSRGDMMSAASKARWAFRKASSKKKKKKTKPPVRQRSVRPK